MYNKYYSVDEIAKILGMHVKTIQKYIREGKIQATKIGKAWQVSGHDLSLFMGQEPEPVTKSAKVSSVVDLTIDSNDDAIRISNMLTASMKMNDIQYKGSTINIMYIEAEHILRIMLWGNLKFTEIMMMSIHQLYEGDQ